MGRAYLTGENMSKSKESMHELPTHAEDPFLTLSAVARELGKSQTTIHRWVQDGLLEAVRQPSGLFAIRKSVVNRFLGGSALKKEIA